ncbi:unnamed protein product, partial [Closterium sp. NIES-54]
RSHGRSCRASFTPTSPSSPHSLTLTSGTTFCRAVWTSLPTRSSPSRPSRRSSSTTTISPAQFLLPSPRFLNLPHC